VPIAPKVRAKEYRLIDFDRYETEAPLVRDPMHLLVALAVDVIPAYEPTSSIRRELIKVIVDPHTKNTSIETESFRQISAAIHDGSADWAVKDGFGDRWRAQNLLALVAAALMHVGRDLPTRHSAADREWCFELAATATGTYLNILGQQDPYAPQRLATTDLAAVTPSLRRLVPKASRREPGDDSGEEASQPAAVVAQGKRVSGQPKNVPLVSRERRKFLRGLDTIAAFALPPVSRSTLVSRSLDDIGAVAGRTSFITGGGGLGKSVLLGQLATELAESPSIAPAVVLMACTLVPPAADLSNEDGVDVAFARAADLPTPELGLRRLVRGLREAHGSVYLLVDTLDVIVSEQTVHAIGSVLADTADDAQLFLTCRNREFEDLFQDPYTSRPKLGWREGHAVQVPKLQVPEILSWASAYVNTLDRSASEKERFIATLSDAVSAATVREVCAVPLRLALACDLYSATGTRVPTDLTITGLYESYWDIRVCRDRQGHLTAQGAAQESAALWLARSILEQSSSRLALTVGAKRDASDPGMQALLSEGLVRRQTGRYEFFHQTYAEFAIARLLSSNGDDGNLTHLRTSLRDPHSHLWPVARHLLLQCSADDRYRDLEAAVPQLTAEGARIHLLAALTRQSPKLLTTFAQTIKEHDPSLLHSLIPLLADAPPVCAEAALEIGVPLLADIGPKSITDATRTIGIVAARIDPPLRAQYLNRALDLIARRRDELGEVNWLTLPEHLIKPSCSTGPDPMLEQLLAQRYVELGICAQRVILRTFLDREGTKSWKALADEMLSIACPPEMSHAEPVDLLRKCWQTEAIRTDRQWFRWQELLQADLLARWDSAQVRLVVEFAKDPGVRDELLTALVGDEPLPARDRWVNVAKFIADDEPAVVLEALLGVPAELNREVVGSIATLANHLASTLDRASRQTILAVLGRHQDVDPRRIWPALVKLAGPDVDLQQQVLSSFDAAEPADDDDGTATRTWEVVRTSTVDTWLNVGTVDFLLLAKEDFHRLLPDGGGRAAQRRAVFEGRIALWDAEAREWMRALVLEGPSRASARAAANAVLAAAPQRGPLEPALVEWVLRLVPTPHTNAAQRLTTLLTNSELVPDNVVLGNVPEVCSVALARLEMAVDRLEDSQLASALFDLIVRVDKLSPIPTDDIRRVITKLTGPVQAVADRLAQDDSKQTKFEITSHFNLWADAVGKLGLRRLPASEIEPTVREVLTGWDSHDVGTRISRVVAKVLLGILSRSPGFATWIMDELWPASRMGTKLAIAEAFSVHERTTPGRHALALARRDDCPPDVAAQIHKWLRN
jgi:hypothetical protein